MECFSTKKPSEWGGRRGPLEDCPMAMRARWGSHNSYGEEAKRAYSPFRTFSSELIGGELFYTESLLNYQ